MKRDQSSAESPSDVSRYDLDAGLLLSHFRQNVERKGGRLVEPAAGRVLNAWLADNYPDTKAVSSATPEISGNRDIANLAASNRLEDIDLGIARAAIGVAKPAGDAAL